jgi:Zn-dependent protease with chaperone function
MITAEQVKNAFESLQQRTGRHVEFQVLDGSYQNHNAELSEINYLPRPVIQFSLPLARKMNLELHEIEGVIAHELGHAAQPTAMVRKDPSDHAFLGTIIGLSGAIAIATIGSVPTPDNQVLLIGAVVAGFALPVLCITVLNGFCARREMHPIEYDADRRGVEYLGHDGMADALQKMDEYYRKKKKDKPLAWLKCKIEAIIGTRLGPPIPERIRRIRKCAAALNP